MKTKSKGASIKQYLEWMERKDPDYVIKQIDKFGMSKELFEYLARDFMQWERTVAESN